MNKEIISKELKFKAVRSSGAGGQHVNKVATKVVLQFDLVNSNGLSTEEKEILVRKLTNKISKEGALTLFSDKSRSQHLNKEFVTTKFFNLIIEKLKPTKIRRLTKPTKGSIIKKAENKKRHSLKKHLRKKPKF